MPGSLSVGTESDETWGNAIKSAVDLLRPGKEGYKIIEKISSKELSIDEGAKTIRQLIAKLDGYYFDRWDNREERSNDR